MVFQAHVFCALLVMSGTLFAVDSQAPCILSLCFDLCELCTEAEAASLCWCSRHVFSMLC